MSEKPLVKVEHVSKKFCRNLRRSLWYGLKDLGGELTAQNGEGRLQLRPDEFLAVDDVSFELHRGECLGLVGANGAGKSTLLKMLNGLVRPDAGRITVCGRVGALIELGAGFNPILTGRENVYINGAVLGLSKKEIDTRFDEIVEFAELGEFIDAPVQSYSSGMRVRLGFAVAANLRPHVLLVDEVLAVGDVSFRMKCYQHMLNLKEQGLSIILVSHNMLDVSRVCDYVAVLVGGKKIYEGDTNEGIAAYESALLTAARRTETRWRHRYTEAYVLSTKITDQSGNLKEEFLTGETVYIDVLLESRHQVDGARLLVHISTPSTGHLGAFSTASSGFSFNVIPPATRLRLALKNVPLLVGSYAITLSLYGPGIEDFLTDAPNVATFKIVGPPVNTFGYGVSGTIRFDHEWRRCLSNADD